MDPVTLLCSVIVIGLGFDSFHFSDGTYLQFDFKRVKGSQLYRTSLSSLISHDVNGMEFVEYSVIHSKTLGDKRTRVEIRCYCLFQKCDRYWNCYRGWNNGTKSGNQTFTVLHIAVFVVLQETRRILRDFFVATTASTFCSVPAKTTLPMEFLMKFHDPPHFSFPRQPTDYI